jgi:hypothetical protein
MVMMISGQQHVVVGEILNFGNTIIAPKAGAKLSKRRRVVLT